MSVRHAAVEPAFHETLTDSAFVPALVPLGLHRDNLQVFAVLLHALNDVDDHASQLKITTSLLWAFQVGEREVVDVLGQDHARQVTVLTDAGQNRDIVLIDRQIGHGVRLGVRLVLVIVFVPIVPRILLLL